MNDRPALRPSERRYGWTLAVMGAVVALIAQTTRQATDDVSGLLGVLGLVFALGYLALLAACVLVARYLMASSSLRLATILAGPVVGLLVLNAVIRLLL